MPARCSHSPCSRIPEPGFKTCAKCLARERAYKKKHQRRMDLKRRYNLTLDEYDAILASQDGRCAICRRLPEPGRNLCIDHSHGCCAGERSCGKCIRGLLCYRCNVGIGYLGDSAEVLLIAANYVERVR